MVNLTDLCLAPKKGESLDQQCSSCGSCGPDDRFSCLPNDILAIIMSFLTTNQVVSMSLISHRYLDVWMYTPILNFIDSPSTTNFVKSVNYALGVHKCPNLKEFKIVKFLDSEFSKDINNWLVVALSRNVERLELNFLVSGLYAEDSGTNYDFTTRRFLQYDLKCLKSLSLGNLYALDEDIGLLIHNCPSLERLELVGIHAYFASLVISGPNLALKYLRIKDCDSLESLSISGVNLVSLEIPSLGEDLTLTDLPMLVELSISGKRVTFFKKSLTLSLVGSCFNSQLEVVTLLKLRLEEVIDLDCLARMIKLRRLFVEVMARNDESLSAFISIINSCPRLEEFVLMLYCVDEKRTTRNIYYVEDDKSSLQSKSKTLKLFEFLGYFGRASDVELIVRVVENTVGLIVRVVENTVGLEKIVIDPRFPFYLESKVDRETKTLALEQIDFLKITQCIPPHIDVIIC